MTDRPEKFKGALCMLLATLLWGSSFAVTKGEFDDFPACFLVGARLFMGGVFLAAVFHKKLKTITKRTLRASVLPGLFFAVGSVLETLGVIYTNAGRAAFVTAAYCIFTPFLEWWILKNRPKLTNLLTAAVCLTGIGLIVLKGDFTVDRGDLLTLAGSLCFALEIVFFGRSVEQHDDVLLSIGMLLVGGVFALALSPFVESPPPGIAEFPVPALIYLGIACSGIPIVLQGRAQNTLTPSVMTVLLGFEAVNAAVISALTLHETFTGPALIGCILVFLSSFVSLL